MTGQRDFLGGSPVIQIKTDEGAAAGIVGGERVIVRSANGELTGIAKVDDSIRRGAVSIRTATSRPTSIG